LALKAGAVMASVVIEGMDERPVPGNLKAHVQDNKLLLPNIVVAALHRDGVRTAEDLMSYILAFPSSVADILHWSLVDVERATTKLRRELKGHVSDAHLHPQWRPNPPLGALDPDDLP
jgi:hypothetical protein